MEPELGERKPHPLDEPQPEGEDRVEWGGEPIMAMGFTEGGAPLPGRGPDARDVRCNLPRSSDGIPPEVEKELYLDFMDQHYQGWLDEPVPALSGMNPREAVAAKGGRRRVAELIRQIEHGQAMQYREKGFAYDTSWLWEELGLDPAQD